MKKIENLTDNERVILTEILESVTPQSVTTIKDLRMIDRICRKVEASDGSIDLEDTEDQFITRRLGEFAGWLPKARGEILPLAEKLGI